MTDDELNVLADDVIAEVGPGYLAMELLLAHVQAVGLDEEVSDA